MAKIILAFLLLILAMMLMHNVKADMSMVHYGYCKTTNGQPDPLGNQEYPCAIFTDSEIPNKFFVALLDKEVIVTLFEIDNQTLSKRVVYSRPSI